MSEFRALNEVVGLQLNGNPLTLPPSSAVILENFECVRDNVYRKVRGRNTYGSKLPDKDIIQFLEYDNYLIVVFSDGDIYYDSDGAGVFAQYTGSFPQPDSDYLNQSIETSGNLYFTTSTGIKKLDTVSGTPTSAGLPRGLSFDLRVVDVTGNWLTTAYTTAYRHCWTFTDANKNTIRSAPSEMASITNSSGADRAVEHRITIPSGITVNHYLEIYRATSLNGTPAEDYQLCYQAKPTSGEITANEMVVNDVLADGFRGAYLYTNPTQQGIAESNDRPPLAKSITKYKNFTIYGNVIGLHKLFTSLVGVSGLSAGVSTLTIADGTNTLTLGSIGTAAATNVTDCIDNGAGLIRVVVGAGHGLSNGDYTRIIDVGGVSAASGVWAVNVISSTVIDLIGSSFTGSYTAGGTSTLYEDIGTTPRFLIYTSGTASQNIDNTARSIVRCINQASGNTFWYAYYNSGPTDPVGKISLEARSHGADEFYITVNSAATGGMFSPTIPTSGTDYNSDADEYPNGFMYSKDDQPEHVPTKNIIPVGNANDPILSVVGLRDSLFIIQQKKGVSRMTGDSQASFNVDEFDGTTSCIQKNSIAKGDNAIFMFTDGGFVKISDVGVEIIGRPIDYKALTPIFASNFENYGYGWFYEVEKTYYISTFSGHDSEDNDIVWKYNTITKSWSQNKHGVYTSDSNIRCARVINNILFTAPLSGSVILRERKAYSVNDFANPDISVNILTIDTDNKRIVIDTEITIPKDAYISQGNNLRRISTIEGETSFVLSSVNNLTVGAVTIISGIKSKIRYQMATAGLPEYEKLFNELSIYFDNDPGNLGETSIGDCEVKTYTDNVGTQQTTPMIASGLSAAWGEFKWGEIAWGGIVVRDKMLTLTPRDHSLGTYLVIEINHERPREQMAICGYSIIYDVTDPRYRRR